MALMRATCTGVNAEGRPERGASTSDANPGAAHQRRRHLRTVSSQTRSDRAITAVGCPWAAANTILAPVTNRCSLRPARVSRVNARRCEPVSVIRSVLVGDIHELPWPNFSLATSASLITGVSRFHDTRVSGTISSMAAPPASTQTSLQQRLSTHARQRWPQLRGIDVRFHGTFAYVTAQLPDGDTTPLMRLRYGGTASR